MTSFNINNCSMGDFPAHWTEEENEILIENINRTPRERYSELKYYTELMVDLPQKRLRDIVLRYRYLEQLKINPNEQWRDFWEKSREAKSITPTRSHSSSSGEETTKKSRRRKSRSPQRQKKSTPTDSPRMHGQPMDTESNTMLSNGMNCENSQVPQMKIIDTGTSTKHRNSASMTLDEVMGNQSSGEMEPFCFSPETNYKMNGMQQKHPLKPFSNNMSNSLPLNSSLNNNNNMSISNNMNNLNNNNNINTNLNSSKINPLNSNSHNMNNSSSLSSNSPGNIPKGIHHKRNDSPTRAIPSPQAQGSMTPTGNGMMANSNQSKHRTKIIYNNPSTSNYIQHQSQQNDRKQYMFQPVYSAELDNLMTCLNDGENLIREIESDLIMSGHINIDNVEAFREYVIRMIDQTTNVNGFQLPQFTQRLIIYENQQGGYSFAYLSDH